ncbi:regulatory protein RecX [Chloroflexota bacterium]
MASKITALKYQKRNRDRVSVYLDGRFAFGLPAIVAASLRPGQVLTDAEIESLRDQGNVEAAYTRTLDYLSYRPRSQAEVIAYLQKRGLSEGSIDTITGRLERAGLLDDEAFAQYWIENRERFRPRGSRALRHELWNKGISQDIIDRAVASVDGPASAYRAASRKAQQLSHLDQGIFRQKLVQYLARRGFGYEIAREVAERHWAELAKGD